MARSAESLEGRSSGEDPSRLTVVIMQPYVVVLNEDHGQSSQGVGQTVPSQLQTHSIICLLIINGDGPIYWSIKPLML